MRKNVKRFTSAALAATMVLSMGSIAALAADVTITTDESGTTVSKHTYSAYQIFSGTVSDGVLTDIAWANGVDSSSLLTALQDSTAFNDEGGNNPFNNLTVENVDEIAEALAQITSKSANAKTLAQLIGANLAGTATATSADGKFTGLADGYYLIKDANAITGNDAATAFILQVVGEDINVQVKSEVPTLEKKVLELGYTTDNTDSGEAAKYGTDYNDVADYSIGDLVSFRLYGTVPTNYQDYQKAYWYQFSDTLGDGLTYYDGEDEDTIVDVKVTVGVGGTEIPAAYYTVAHDEANNNAFTVTFNNLKDIKDADDNVIDLAGATIVVEYQAYLNANAVIGNPGNHNTALLKYSNNPNVDGGSETGTTPEDEVVVLTYGIDIAKVDGDDTTKPLSGVEFVIKKGDSYLKIDESSKKVTLVDEDSATTFTTDEDGKIKVTGLEDGTYTLVETKPLDGYNTIDDVTVAITATTSNGQNVTDLNNALTALTGGDTGTGLVSKTVENFKGSVLPSTGGIGTTIFYVVGIALMAGAAVVLVAKKKSSVE